MSHRSLLQFVAPVLCFTLIGACGSSSTTPSSDASGAAGAKAGAGGGAAGADGGGAGGSAAGAGGNAAGTSGSDAGAGTGAAGSGSDAAAGAGGASVDGAAGASDAGTDAGADLGAAGAGVDAGTCPMIANVATTFADGFMPTVAVPVGTGGVISDGTYTMTALVNYMNGSTTPKMHTYTFKITGAMLALTGHDNANPDQSGGFTVTANPVTGSIALVGFCPPDLLGSHLGNLDSYTATASVLHLYSSSKFQEVVLTKQ